jgi:hypothetical protein
MVHPHRRPSSCSRRRCTRKTLRCVPRGCSASLCLTRGRGAWHRRPTSCCATWAPLPVRRTHRGGRAPPRAHGAVGAWPGAVRDDPTGVPDLFHGASLGVSQRSASPSARSPTLAPLHGGSSPGPESATGRRTDAWLRVSPPAPTAASLDGTRPPGPARPGTVVAGGVSARAAVGGLAASPQTDVEVAANEVTTIAAAWDGRLALLAVPEGYEGVWSQFFLQMLLARHARRMMLDGRIRALGRFARALGFPLSLWLAKERCVPFVPSCPAPP